MQHTLYSRRQQEKMQYEKNMETATWIFAGVITLLAIMIVMAIVYTVMMGFI